MVHEEDLSYPIGKEDQQKEFTIEFNEQLKNSLIRDLKMLPSDLEYAIQDLDFEQLQTPYREAGAFNN